MYSKLYIFILIVALSGSQSLFAQNRTDANGRSAAQLAAKKDINPNILASARGGDDEIPGQGEDKDEGTYPLPSGDSLTGHAELDELSSRVQDLLARLDKLELTDTELQTELDNIKKGLEMCCGSGASLDDRNETAHLLQNAPNPFIDRTNIQYFLPENSGMAFLEIRNLEGTVLKSYPIIQEGIGSIKVEDTSLLSGGYLYTLSIDGQILDSKIMIIAK